MNIAVQNEYPCNQYIYYKDFPLFNDAINTGLHLITASLAT